MKNTSKTMENNTTLLMILAVLLVMVFIGFRENYQLRKENHQKDLENKNEKLKYELAKQELDSLLEMVESKNEVFWKLNDSLEKRKMDLVKIGEINDSLKTISEIKSATIKVLEAQIRTDKKYMTDQAKIAEKCIELSNKILDKNQ